MIPRPTKDEYFITQAISASSRASCPRRRVGCVLVNEHDHIIATGYNGPPSAMQNCTDVPCPGADAKSGEGLDRCRAIHAEANALLQCADVQAIKTAYVTASPCRACTLLLLNTSCQRIVYYSLYPHSDAQELWKAAGREWTSIHNLITTDSLVYAIACNFGYGIRD